MKRKKEKIVSPSSTACTITLVEGQPIPDGTALSAFLTAHSGWKEMLEDAREKFGSLDSPFLIFTEEELQRGEEATVWKLVQFTSSFIKEMHWVPKGTSWPPKQKELRNSMKRKTTLMIILRNLMCRELITGVPAGTKISQKTHLDDMPRDRFPFQKDLADGIPLDPRSFEEQVQLIMQGAQIAKVKESIRLDLSIWKFVRQQDLLSPKYNLEQQGLAHVKVGMILGLRRLEDLTENKEVLGHRFIKWAKMKLNNEKKKKRNCKAPSLPL